VHSPAFLAAGLTLAGLSTTAALHSQAGVTLAWLCSAAVEQWTSHRQTGGNSFLIGLNSVKHWQLNR